MTKTRQKAASHSSRSPIATIGIDLGKNSFHVVGFDGRGAIVLRQKISSKVHSSSSPAGYNFRQGSRKAAPPPPIGHRAIGLDRVRLICDDEIV